ncbi:phosphatidylserine decarboxylase [Sphingomonas sp.]|uniref:phosphatidylserine decarboxylase n=1 Tax=Sphingomonas sp. TaxID=28214 RepID=UPI0025E1A1FA|nr:phosphatidylserine decarboxylase [Sphingomonas sp.]
MASQIPGSTGSTPSGQTPQINGVKWRFPPVHPEGRKFAAIAAGITFIAFIWVHWLTWPLIILTVWVAAFFRDPVRSIPQGSDLIIAPADGLITLIETVPVPRELSGEGGLGDLPVTRVSIFMSVFDVHINRTPISGTVTRVVYIAGKFLNADLDKASEENERQHLLVERSDGVRIGFTQIAGLVARRIMPFVKPGDMVAAGQRIGLIRFGSRVDVFLPAGTAPRVVLGQRSVAGETVLAVIGNASPASGISQ